LAISCHRQIVFPLIHPDMAQRWTFKSSTLVLWLYQRHTLKAFRAYGGDVEGHKTDCVLTQVETEKGLEHDFYEEEPQS